MAVERQEVAETEVAQDGAVTRNKTVTNSTSGSGAYKVEQIVYLLFGILEAILLIRIILSLLGANKGNAFAQFIYGVSYPFVQPFFGLFGYTFHYGVARFEFETLVAMIVYALIGWVIVKIIQIARA